MGLLIDTSVFASLERAEQKSAVALEEWSADEWFISAVTMSELLHGVHRAPADSIRAKRHAFVESILLALPVVPVDVAAARMHARLWAELASGGQMIGPHDLWIAATAVAHGLSILTENVRDFRRIRGLQVVTWRPAART